MARQRMGGAPPAGAGLVRYFDVDEGGPKIEPKLLIGVIVAIIIIEIVFAQLL